MRTIPAWSAHMGRGWISCPLRRRSSRPRRPFFRPLREVASRARQAPTGFTSTAARHPLFADFPLMHARQPPGRRATDWRPRRCRQSARFKMKRELFSAVSALALLPCVAPLQAAEPDGERLETLTIEALPLQDVSAAESVQPAKVVAGEELIKQRDRSLGRSLSSEPGISSADFGIGVGRPVVRGLSGPRVRVQENGLSAADVSTLSVDHAVSIDTLTARQIEVLKGPATLLYGSGAIGGVVNVVTDRIPRSAPTRVGGEIDFSVNDSTVGGAATALSLTGGLGDFAWRLHGDTRQTGDYQADGDQRLDNSATETDTSGAGGSWSGSRGYLGAAVASHASTYGIPGEEAQIDLSQDRIDLAGELYEPFPYFERLKVSAAHTDYLHTEGEAGIPEVFFDNEEAEVRVELNHAPAGGWRGALGLQATDRQFEAFGEEEVFVPPTDTRSAALFAVEEYSFGNGLDNAGRFPRRAAGA
ncbi:MAG: hypothetical protein CMN28_07280 [Salinisphaeraceae bacterium]|nr:hypothetical protein [Salinisphaeraceae bacterium]